MKYKEKLLVLYYVGNTITLRIGTQETEDWYTKTLMDTFTEFRDTGVHKTLHLKTASGMVTVGSTLLGWMFFDDEPSLYERSVKASERQVQMAEDYLKRQKDDDNEEWRQSLRDD